MRNYMIDELCLKVYSWAILVIPDKETLTIKSIPDDLTTQWLKLAQLYFITQSPLACTQETYFLTSILIVSLDFTQVILQRYSLHLLRYL